MKFIDTFEKCLLIQAYLVSSYYSDGSNTILSNIEWTWTSFFIHQMNSNVFIYWWSNLNTWILASNEWTSNIKPKRPSFTTFTRFTKLLIKQTWTSSFRTSNELERVHFLVIEFKHPIFGFKQSNIELRTQFNPSLTVWRFLHVCLEKLEVFGFLQISLYPIFNCNSGCNYSSYCEMDKGR